MLTECEKEVDAVAQKECVLRELPEKMKDLKWRLYSYVGKVSFIITREDKEVIHQVLHLPIPRLEDDIEMAKPEEEETPAEI